MKTRIDTDEECGALSPNPERSPDQEVLEEQAEIFSCGGVYLADCQSIPAPAKKTDYLFLPTHRKETLVYRGTKLVRRSGTDSASAGAIPQERSASSEVLKKFFKESLN